jgi:hypothetical protein
VAFNDELSGRSAVATAEWPLPELHLPVVRLDFPGLHHPDTAGAERHTRAWLDRWGLFDEAAKVRNASHLFGHLGAYGYPFACREALWLAADWATWLYAFDDGHVDEPAPDPVGVSSQIAALLRVLEGGIALTPLAGALADIAARYRRLGSAAQVAHFRAAVRGYLLGCLAEITYRSARSTPTVDDYLPLRVQASATLSCLAMVEIASGGTELEPAQLHDPAVEVLTRHAAYIIAVVNDLFSCTREISNCPVDFVFNLPLVCAHADGRGLQAGLDRTAAIANREIRAFADLYARAEPPAAPPVQAHLRAVRAWLQGTYDWMVDCGRYRPYWNPAEWPAAPAA